MEGAVLSTPSGNRFRSHLKNAASALCARTLPKQRRNDSGAGCTARHHTYPRATPPKRAAISCRLEAPVSHVPQLITPSEPLQCKVEEVLSPTKCNGVVKLKGTLAREVANAWGCRVGPPDEPAPADRVQNLFNDIELYPTKTQVFEMLVCARQCARRKSLTLTFGEFCVFAAELRKCSRQARHTPTKPESPLWNVERENRDKHVNGSEAAPPPCEVFLGGSCNPTTWRSDIAIPMLKKMGITYFNPQVEDWSSELMEIEHRAKAAARALLFVLDSETRAVGAAVEVAQLASTPRDLLLVLRPYSRHQPIGNETISDQEYVELSRARATLQEAVERRGLPAFTDIPAALRCARAVLRGARTNPRHSLGHTILRLKRAYDSAGGRNTKLPRNKAVDALRDIMQVQREVVDRCLPPTETVDFEMFCAAVAELASDAENGGGVCSGCGRPSAGGVAARVRRAFRSLCDRLTPSSPESPVRPVQEADAGAGTGVVAGAGAAERAGPRDANGLHTYNARLRAYGRKLGLYIPKNNGTRVTTEGGSAGGIPPTVGTGTGTGPESASSGDSVFTPGTERRLERLPAMLGAPTHDVYLGGSFPTTQTRPEDILRREGYTYVVPRANDYTRMFSCPARRTAPAHPESPRHDKKPRPSPTEEVQLRDRSAEVEPADRLSASDFYTVTEDHTPQPFKGTYDEDLLLGSRMLVFSMSAEAPCFSTMVLAAHYMGLRPHSTALLVQPMQPPAAHTHTFSEAAVKDYNRGRHYLTDLATRSGIPVFDNIDDTMNYVIQRLRASL